MMNKTMNMAKGSGRGVRAGVAGAAVRNNMRTGGHRTAGHMRKSAGKAMHSVGNLIGDVEKMLR